MMTRGEKVGERKGKGAKGERNMENEKRREGNRTEVTKRGKETTIHNNYRQVKSLPRYIVQTHGRYNVQ